MRTRPGDIDKRILALRTTSGASVELPDGTTTTIGALVEAPEQAASALSVACMAVFNGNKKLRTLCRRLDLLAYGTALTSRSSEVVSSLLDDPVSKQDGT